MAGTPVEIPLTPSQNQSFLIALGVNTYKLTFQFNDQPDAGWEMDIGDENGNPLVDGIPLVTGEDLLAQYHADLAAAGLDIPGQFIVQTDHNVDAIPTFDNLGVNSHLYYIPNA